MRIRILLSALVLGAGLSLAAVAADADRVAKLIADLGSAKFADREQATKELEALGQAALEPLRKAAAKAGDLETRRRAEELIGRIEGQLGSQKILAASRVRLKYTNTPILKAVEDVAAKTGYTISYIDAPAKLNGRTVTLDTGETTFWEAFDQFCRRAGLVEGTPEQLNQPPVRPRPLPPNTVLPANGQYRLVTLIDGQPQPRPTDYVGAVRVRAFPPEMQLLGAPPLLAKEVRVLLELAPEPRVEFQRLVDLRIDRAVDDRGQSLTPLKVAAAENNLPPQVAAAATSLVPGNRVYGRHVPLRLEAAAQPSRKLKELKGTAVAQVRTPPQVMAAVDEVLKAAGKTVKGEQGVTLTVRDVKKHEDGRVEMQVTVERPTDVYAYYQPVKAADAGGAPVPAGPAQIQVVPRANIQIRAIQVKPVPAPAPGAVPPQPPAPNPAPPADKAPNPAPNAVPPQPNPVPQQAVPVQVRPVQVQGAAARARDFGVTFVGLTALDARGERLPLADARSLGARSVQGVIIQEVAVTFKPGAGQGEPAKLIFTGTRNTSVDITFTLKDVPLP